MSTYSYSMLGYSRMIADRARTAAYAEALRTVIRPGSVVVDIGTGTGFFALLACRYGARRVVAIDPSPAVAAAAELARANGCGRRIEFVQGLSTSVDLGERADVIVSDLRGAVPIFQAGLQAIVDARDRMLRPDGHLVPRVDTLWAALARVPVMYARHVAGTEADVQGINMAPLRRYITNALWTVRLTADQIASEPRRWAVLDYASLAAPDVGGSMEWTIPNRRTVHGIAVWFDSHLSEEVAISSAPAARPLVYGQALLPFPDPLELVEGDVVGVELTARFVQGEYVWCWSTGVNGATRTGVHRFRQSTFFAQPWTSAATSGTAGLVKPRAT